MSGNRIALDVMGGDDAPDSLLRGAQRAVAAEGEQHVPAERILLVGDEKLIRERLEALGGDPGFGIQHASQFIGMDESPAQALRAKPDNSIMGCVRAIKTGEAGAMVAMGNTGAVVGASTLGLKTLEGVSRPGIAVTLGLTGNPITLLDMGANIAPKPEHLAQYAEMAGIYMRDCIGVEKPRIGLLNVGEEKGKGTQVLKDAYDLIEAGNADFIGNVEGSDLFTGACDVVVTDGFTGNVVLKLLEHFAGFMMGMMMKQLQAHGNPDWSREALGDIKSAIDYSTYGGALLLGVRGVVVIGHGRSDASAVANAIAVAGRAIDSEVLAHIEQGLTVN